MYVCLSVFSILLFATYNENLGSVVAVGVKGASHCNVLSLPIYSEPHDPASPNELHSGPTHLLLASMIAKVAAIKQPARCHTM